MKDIIEILTDNDILVRVSRIKIEEGSPNSISIVYTQEENYLYDYPQTRKTTQEIIEINLHDIDYIIYDKSKNQVTITFDFLSQTMKQRHIWRLILTDNYWQTLTPKVGDEGFIMNIYTADDNNLSFFASAISVIQSKKNDKPYAIGYNGNIYTKKGNSWFEE